MLERDISAPPPQVRDGTVVVPRGLLRRAVKAAAGELNETTAERALGHAPKDVSGERLGYDIESRDQTT